jgi:iron-sulfur cluster assembly accessory protein
MAIIKLTKIARKKLVELLCHHNRKTVLFSVAGGGCNGLKYQLQPTNDPIEKLDEEIPLTADTTLRICGKSIFYLLGTEIDWKDDFMGQSFHFSNPNTASTCGCGSTFSPKKVPHKYI